MRGKERRKRKEVRRKVSWDEETAISRQQTSNRNRTVTATHILGNRVG